MPRNDKYHLGPWIREQRCLTKMVGRSSVQECRGRERGILKLRQAIPEHGGLDRRLGPHTHWDLPVTRDLVTAPLPELGSKGSSTRSTSSPLLYRFQYRVTNTELAIPLIERWRRSKEIRWIHFFNSVSHDAEGLSPGCDYGRRSHRQKGVASPFNAIWWESSPPSNRPARCIDSLYLGGGVPERVVNMPVGTVPSPLLVFMGSEVEVETTYRLPCRIQRR
jgi:hypothetical protein